MSHLLRCSYNSVVFSTSLANGYVAAVVTESFLEGQTFELFSTLYEFQTSTTINGTLIGASMDSYSRASEIVGDLQGRLSSLKRLEPYDCANIYSKSFIDGYSNVVLVTKVANSIHYGGSVIKYSSQFPIGSKGAYQLPSTWECDIFVDTEHPLPQPYPTCDPNTILQNLDTFRFKYCSGSSITDPDSWPAAGVQYCLAEETTSSCTIQMSVPIMILVIIFNALKALIFLTAIKTRSFKPLITLGDALASFLEKPDEHTRRLGPVSADEIRARVKDGEQKRRLRRTGHNVYTPARRVARDSDDSMDRPAILDDEVLPEVHGRRQWRFGASVARWILSYSL